VAACGINYGQENALKGRRFESLGAENLFLSDWESRVADTRIHGTTRQQVGKAFEEVERSKLLPLRTLLRAKPYARQQRKLEALWAVLEDCVNLPALKRHALGRESAACRQLSSFLHLGSRRNYSQRRNSRSRNQTQTLQLCRAKQGAFTDGDNRGPCGAITE
jgi:hypothetical protein